MLIKKLFKSTAHPSLLCVIYMVPIVLAQAVITTHHRLSDLNNKHLFPHCSEGREVWYFPPQSISGPEPLKEQPPLTLNFFEFLSSGLDHLVKGCQSTARTGIFVPGPESGLKEHSIQINIHRRQHLHRERMKAFDFRENWLWIPALV